MSSLRLVLISLSVSLLPFALGGCSGSKVSTSTPGSPSNPGSSGSSSSVAAYVYASSQSTSGATPTQTVAYSVDSNGQLATVSGSPFSLDIGSMAATKAYLVAAANSGSNINTYTISSNGALTPGPQFSDAQIDSQIGTQVGGTCGMAVVTFDHTGQSLYTEVTCASGVNYYNLIGSFAFDSSNGTLNYLGDANTGATANSPALSLLGNGQYAYQIDGNGCSTFTGGGVFSFARNSSGLLTAISTVTTPKNGPPMPPGATAGSGPFGYVPGLGATDNTNHAAFQEDACFFVGGANQPIQLAAYTVNSDGSLTTTDTYATMPSTTINPIALEISPDGTLLAVGGSGGVQVFHFNGAGSITTFTGVLTTDNISQIAWDSSNHLYALMPFPTSPGNTSGPGKLHVFAVTSSGATEAPGSPYTIQNPRYLVVSDQAP